MLVRSRLMHIHQRHTGTKPPEAELHLSFDARQKSRFRATLKDGRDVVVVMPRGQSLKDGELLQAEDGTVVLVRATPEPVSLVRSDDVLLLSRAAYHLGNRHMPVQILPGELRYHHDHVLDDLLHQLGLHPVFAELPFEPESGAYGAGHSFASHPHHHSHANGEHAQHHHSHTHAHPHPEDTEASLNADTASSEGSPRRAHLGAFVSVEEDAGTSFTRNDRAGKIHVNWSVDSEKDGK